MRIKKTYLYLMLLFSFGCMTNCTQPVQHSDPFYNENGDDFPQNRLPLIKPIHATRDRSFSPWYLGLGTAIMIKIPSTNNAYYAYDLVEELEKIAVKNGVVMAYSSYVDTGAPDYIQDNYYHWFVLIPDKKIAEGFHTEDEFNQHIQTLDIQNPEWQTPDEAYEKFAETGCLDWIPDCK